MTKKLDILIYILLIVIVVVIAITFLGGKSDVYVKSITLDKKNVSIYIGEKSMIKATVEPANATNKTLTWKSNNPTVATVNNNGVISSFSEGEAVITVSTTDESVKETFRVTVLAHNVERIILDKDNLFLKIGETSIINAIAEPDIATYKKLYFKSTDENIVSVDANGQVLAKRNGEVEIIVTDEKGLAEARCRVTVGVALERIEMESNLELFVGKEGMLNAKLIPANTTYTNIKWSSNDTTVATVDSTGKVIARKEGTAIITVTGDNNIKAKCTVTVKREPISVTDVKISKTSVTLNIGKTVTLSSRVVPSNADNKKVIWTSSNTSVAKVNQSGLVTATRSGTAIITVTSTENGKKATCKVTVKANTLKPLVPSNGIMIKYESSTLKYYVQNNNRYYLTFIWMEDPYNQIRKLDPNTGVYGKILTDEEMDSKGLTRYRKTIGDTMNDYIAKGIIPVNKSAIGFNGGGFYVAGSWTPPSPYYDKRSSSWIVVQNGVLTRNRINADDTPIDTIIGIAEGGVLKSYGSGSGSAAVRQKIYNAIKKDKVNNTWAFNPLLVGNGVDTSWWTQAYAQRNAICQINANNYVMFSSANGSSHYFELANIFKSLGCKTAMNLDGGGSTSFFIKKRGESSVTKIKCGESNGRCREVIEGIYFTEK